MTGISLDEFVKNNPGIVFIDTTSMQGHEMFNAMSEEGIHPSRIVGNGAQYLRIQTVHEKRVVIDAEIRANNDRYEATKRNRQANT